MKERVATEENPFVEDDDDGGGEFDPDPALFLCIRL